VKLLQRKIKITKGESISIGKIPKGCRYCIEGEKVVIFMTGKCSRKCYYCPLSNVRKNSNKIFADEILVKKDEDILREAELIDAKGASLTGGDPLLKFDKTIKYIKLLKEKFGEQFHIHLYTTGHNLTEEKAKQLIEAKLDEIRFHTEIFDLNKVNFFKNSKLEVGCEIPAIPGKENEIIEFIKFLEKNQIAFININELEFSDTNAENLKNKGYSLKKDSIAAVKDSEETALKVLKWAEKNTRNIIIHYCPSKLKDSVQLRNRFKRRAKNVKKSYEDIDQEGLLLSGVFHIKEDLDIDEIEKILTEKYEVPTKLMGINKTERRIYTTWYIAEELAKEMEKIGIKTQIIKCFPTDDRFMVYSYYIS
jgi:pyruvate formate-lyase activating enzyme-like uncharacterized protein